MNFEEGKSAYPVGKLHELEANKEALPAIEVKNKVLWVNPDLDIPFKLKVGEPTNLGMFLTNEVQEGDKKIKNLETATHHNRSALLGRVIFGEKKREGKDRQLFRDIDIKGTGYVLYRSPEFSEPRPNVEAIRFMGQTSSFGILDVKDANHDMGIAETFHEYGVRVHRVVAIIELEEIIYEGKKISIAKAKAKELIDDSAQPVLEVRAFGTHARLLDAHSDKNSLKNRELFIDDARLLIAQELGENPEEFDNFKYAKWLAKTIGKNVGLMHKNGFVHKYLPQGHNITLDGCLVDFDSVQHTGSRNSTESKNDYLQAGDALQDLIRRMGGLDISQQAEIFSEYDNSYSAYKSEPTDEGLLSKIEEASRKYR
ncbi:MAG: hypothetical protein M3M85_03055 [bacterium]|nr:hypothetical protein [bacterium]